MAWPSGAQTGDIVRHGGRNLGEGILKPSWNKMKLNEIHLWL